LSLRGPRPKAAAAPLDTLRIVKQLEEAGFHEPQAKALTIVLRDLGDLLRKSCRQDFKLVEYSKLFSTIRNYARHAQFSRETKYEM
jgi:hypothetical protein